MSITDTFFGTPPQTTIHQTPATRDPGYGFAQQFFNWLPSLMNRPYPTYQGQIDPGLSPTMQEAIRRSQGYAQSSPNEILQGVQGSIGRFMNPNFLNPFNQLFGGSSNWFGVNPNQPIFGGRPAGSMTYQQGVWPQPGPQPQVNAPQMSAPMMYQQPQAMPQTAQAQMPSAGSLWGGPASSVETQRAWAQLSPDQVNQEFSSRYGQNWANRPGFHVSDYESALRAIHGREPTFEETQNAWQQGGDQVITQGRNAFIQQSGMRPEGRMAELIDQLGSVARGTRAYEEELAAQGIR